MNVILKGEKSVMKLKRKLLAGLLTLCMAVGMAVPAFAEKLRKPLDYKMN